MQHTVLRLLAVSLITCVFPVIAHHAAHRSPLASSGEPYHLRPRCNASCSLRLLAVSLNHLRPFSPSRSDPSTFDFLKGSNIRQPEVAIGLRIANPASLFFSRSTISKVDAAK